MSRASGVGRRASVACAAFCLATATLACGGDIDTTGRGNATEQGADPLPPAEPRMVVAVVDFSGSQTTHAVREARGYLEQIVDGLSYGDRFVLLEMYRTGSRDSVGKFVQDMPDPLRAGRVTSYDRRQLDAAKAGVKNALPIFFDPRFAERIATTDVLTTLHIASEFLLDANGRDKQLVLLSDMLQSTSAWEFERARRMPQAGWVDAQASGDLLPSLEGTCVVVVGADPTTPDGQRVRVFWSEYFEATGASLVPENYRLRAPVGELSC